MERQDPLTNGISDQLKETFIELQETTIILAIPGLFISALIFISLVISAHDFIWALTTGFLLLLLTVLLMIVHRKSFLLSASLIVLASFGAVLSAIFLGNFSAAVCLLIVPVGLSTLMFGITFGFGAAVACSVFILGFGPLQNYGLPEIRYISLIAVWATFGMLWLTLRPLLSAVEGAWSNYERSRMFLRQAQEYQFQLGQTLTDLKDANSQLTRLNQLANGLRRVAEEERHAKEQFVANVSHELRTPLNMIIGFSEMILKAPRMYGRNLPANLLADLEVVLRNSQHLSSLIDDVLDLSQIQAGQMSLSKEQSSIEEIIQAATIAVRPLYESKNLYLHVEVQESLPVIQCDRTRVREVLLNLLSNAGRFTETGGVTLRSVREENWIVTSISDTGKGISEEDKGKLFRPFQQLDGSIRRKYGGTGLGLSISKSFVELHDGKMWVESEEGEGTTFYFRLPVEVAEQSQGKFTRWFNPHIVYQEGERHHGQPAQEVRPRIVIVDPSPDLPHILTRHMESFEIKHAETFEQGMAELEESPARAMVFNDLAFPSALERSRAAGSLPYNTPAIFCSVPIISEQQDELGVSGYLVKPILRDQLINAIQRIDRPVKTLLIVDDEPDAQQLFRRMLTFENRRYRVLRAGNGFEALDILRGQEIDLILLDLLMPGMNGYQFLLEKKQNKAWENIPVILISARDPQEEAVTSSALAVTRSGGLTVQQLMACIEALSLILSPMSPPGDLKPAGASPA